MKMLSQQIIKQNNMKQVFSLVTANEGISRVHLASITQLSKTTVSALVEELINEGFLLDEGTLETNRQGRKPNSLHTNGAENVIAVINWNSTRLQLGFVGIGGELTHYREQFFTQDDDYARQITEAYRRLELSLGIKSKRPRILALCVIVPSMIDPHKKRIFSSVLPVQPGEWIIKRLRAAIPDIPMAFLNDTACFAYAEMTTGPLDESPSIFVNLSGGVGAVMFSAGQMLRGANGMTTQFGHFSVDRHGALCRCGNRGCLERRIGENVLSERAREFMTAERLEAFGRLNYETLGNAADSGDIDFQRLADSLADDLAFALGNFITVYNVRRAVIGGNGRKLGRYFFTQLEKHLNVCGFQEFVGNCELQYSTAASPPEFFGAARYFMNNHFQFLEEMNGKLFL